MKKHTLEGVITLNKDTFYRVGTMPCIAVFTVGIPHSKDKVCKFIDFSDDGYEVQKHVGLVETERAIDKKQHLLDVWFDKIVDDTQFVVKQLLKQMMSGYIVIIILMMQYLMMKNLKKQYQII